MQAFSVHVLLLVKEKLTDRAVAYPGEGLRLPVEALGALGLTRGLGFRVLGFRESLDPKP